MATNQDAQVDTMILKERTEGFLIYEREEQSELGRYLIFEDGSSIEDGWELACCTTYWGANDLVDKMIRGVIAIPSNRLNNRLDKAQKRSDTFNKNTNGDTEYCPLSYRTKSPSDN